MRINYQIMDESQRNSFGKYLPDFKKLIDGATCEEEATYINEVMDRFDEWLNRKGAESFAGFAFNMVYITKQCCGHFEIFQSPCNEYYSLEDNLKLAEEHMRDRCTKCICDFKG